jgi:hypothetical protein
MDFEKAAALATAWVDILCEGRARIVRESTISTIKKQPDGQISDFLSSPLQENIPLVVSGKSVVFLLPSHPRRGAGRDRHERAVGCGGRGCAFDERH